MKWVVSSPENLVSFIQKGVSTPCSGKFLRRVLEANFCRVNGKVERFGSTKLQRGDRVELAPQWEELLISKKPQFTTLYEDDQCIIINKPAGWVSQDRSKCFLVHRLDKDTTGALLFAKSRKDRDALMELFSERFIEKEYLAIVDGNLRDKFGVCDTLLTKKRSYQGQTIWGSGPTGLKAITRWKVLAQGQKASLVQCEPITGRTHQIRVHMAEMGHPILIDRQYATNYRSSFFAKRPLLHARRLKFVFQGKQVQIEAPIPEDMQSLLRAVIPEADALL